MSELPFLDGSCLARGEGGGGAQARGQTSEEVTQPPCSVVNFDALSWALQMLALNENIVKCPCWKLLHPLGLAHHDCCSQQTHVTASSVLPFAVQHRCCKFLPGHLMPAALRPHLPSIHSTCSQQPTAGLYMSCICTITGWGGSLQAVN